MLLGLGFCFLLGRGYLTAASFDAWRPTRATVLASWIEGVPQPGSALVRYEFKVRYRYEANGESQVSTRVREIASNTRKRSKVERLQAQFAVGDEVTCYVDPEDPSQAILLRPTKAPGYTLWFPALFAVGGAGMCVVALRKRHR